MTENKIALVTVGSRDRGKNMAMHLAQQKLHVIITYKSKKEEAEKVVEAIRNIGQKAIALHLVVV